MSHPHDPNIRGDQPEHQPTEKIDTPTQSDLRAYDGQTFATAADGPTDTTPGGPPLPPGPPTSQAPKASWFSGSRRTAIVAGVAGLVIGGVIGGSIGWAATGNDDHGRNDSAYSRQIASGDGGQQQGGQKQGQGTQRRARGAMVGTITAVNGSSWTVAARDGRSVTVVIGQNTTFGTPKLPQQQSDFVVGDRIAIVGKDNSGTIDATRVAKRATKPGASQAPSSATTQPS